MSHYGQAYQANAYPQAGHQRLSTPQSGYAPPQMQQQQPIPPMAAAYQQPYKGTLAPGTRVKVGNITVTVKRYLSEGGFAHVYLVTTSQPIPMPSSVTGAVSASMANSATAERGETVHVLKRMAVPDKAALADVRREVEVHKLLRNQANIVHFIEASATSLQGGGYEIFILMEYCSGGGIISLMNARLRDRLREEEVLKIFGDVCAGVAVMHHLDPPLMHRDLKVENILMAPSTDPGTIPGSRSTSSNLKATFKLCDFGSAAPVLSRKPAKSMDEVKRVEADLNKHTTLQYRAPEMVDVYQRRVIDEKADIWALGVLLYKLCYYTTPFEENGGGPLAILNVQYRIPPQPVYSDRLKQLIHSMLKEQSTDRPTIDQVILNVHQILGTRPPQTAVHYAHAAASGKIAAPPSTLVSGSKTSSASDGAKSKTTGGIDANLISMGPSKKELEQAEARQLELQAQNITPMRRGRPTKASTENADSPDKKLDESMLKNSSSPAPLASEVPAKSAPLWKVPDSKPSSVKTGPLIEGFGDSFAPTPTSVGPESPPVLPKRPTPSSVSPEASSNAANTSERAIDKNLLRASSSNAPSPALSPLRHSPALPGFSVAPSPTASPLPITVAKDAPALAPAQKSGTPRDELTDRFPSLEELDARYATPTASSSPSSSAPVSASSSLPSGAGGQVNVPGLANRASVGAMAGRFERPFEPQRHGSGRASLNKSATISSFSMGDSASKPRSDSVSKRWQPSVIAHDRVGKEQDPKVSGATSIKKTPASKDWLTGDVSDQEDEQRAESAGGKGAKIYATQPRAPSSGSPGAQLGVAQEVEVEEPSSDEDEPTQPEEAVAQRPALPPRLSADRLSSFTASAGHSVSSTSATQTDDEAVNGKSSRPERPCITPGRVKAPSWLVDAVNSPTAVERLMSSSSITSQGGAGDNSLKSPSTAEPLVSPVTDATAAEQLDEAARKAQDQLEALLRGPAEEESVSENVSVQKQEVKDPSPVLGSAAQVKAPAWDDDDEEDEREMSALPKPDLQAEGIEKSSSGGAQNGSIKVHKPSSPPVISAASKPSSSSSFSNIASRWESQREAPSQPAKEKQLVDVATSPTPASSNVDAVKDRFNSISLRNASDPTVSSGAIKPSSIVSQRSHQYDSSALTRPSESAVIQPKRPTPIRPHKSAHLRVASSTSVGGLKPWEREAAQSAAASKNGIVKNSALPAASTTRLCTDEDQDDSSASSVNGAGGGGEDDRFKGVSSLISRWQQNVESNAPGWGRIGGGEGRAGMGPKVANQAAGLVRDKSASANAH
ncbi:related to ARK1-Actin Regulating Kinase [Sporisorium scitamineum]|uniref:non-specific serine/threonine protein kinase n=1 Tax=Sporisorium scitamineum TaxID=49012 RepID=A0A127ZKF6_9BASI|nr:related to ARK1-Actin Regulating Kinase [Sporisorium scitamineum]